MTSGCCYPDTGFAAGAEMQKLFDRMAKDVEEGKPWDTITLANEIGKQPLAFQPGEKWMYGTSADILGAIVEVRSYSAPRFPKVFFVRCRRPCLAASSQKQPYRPLWKADLLRRFQIQAFCGTYM